MGIQFSCSVLVYDTLIFCISGQLSNNNATYVSCLEESTLSTCPCINHLGWENEPNSPR